MKASVPYVLTVSGFDTSGCAGVQADNRAIHALKAMPLNVITANTLQTNEGLMSCELTNPEVLKAQVGAMLRAYPIGAIKIGMLGAAAQVEALVHALKDTLSAPSIVLDPVVYSSSGHRLLDEAGLQKMSSELLPLVDLITPNLEEAKLFDLANGPAVLLTGGHRSSCDAVDILKFPDGHIVEFSVKRVTSANLRGTGCALSSSIAAYLAMGKPIEEACRSAKVFLHDAILANQSRRFCGEGPSFF